MLTGTTTPFAGRVPLICIALTFRRSIWSGSGPEVS
ncbi:Uncharacterised protein [Mycobacterium tuberculosis]|nr:Uncharacterised protein [Mycobacterium tuberculosis]